MGSPTQISNFELMVMLALIRIGDEAYGVPISLEIESHSGKDVAVGSVYAALERLEIRGLVTSRMGEPTAARGGRAKRYFRANQRAIDAARHALTNLRTMTSGLESVLKSR